MRKRSAPLSRFAAIPNETVDDSANLDIMALGLLTVLVRHQDGFTVTLEKIGRKYGYGKDAMATAMGTLQVSRHVIKIRVRDKVTKQWSTEVIVGVSPQEDDAVADILNDISLEEGVDDVQVIEPTVSAIKRAEARRKKLGIPAKPQVGAENRKTRTRAEGRQSENPHSGPTSKNGRSRRSEPTPEYPAVGSPGVLKKTVPEGVYAPSGEDSLSQKTGGSPADDVAPSAEREAAAPSKPSRDLGTQDAGQGGEVRGDSSRDALTDEFWQGFESSLERDLPSAAGGREVKTVPNQAGPSAGGAVSDRQAAAERCGDAWVEARVAKRLPVPPAARARVVAYSLVALEEFSEGKVLDACRDMARRKQVYKDPLRHLEHYEPKVSGSSARRGVVPVPAGAEVQCREESCQVCFGSGWFEDASRGGAVRHLVLV